MATERINGSINLSDDKILENVQMKLVNAADCEEKYQNIPHIDLMDLKAVFYVPVEHEDLPEAIPNVGQASVIVNWSLLNSSGITKDELVAAARKNTYEHNEFKISTMAQVMSEMTGMEVSQPEPDEPQLYVVGNESSVNGSVVLMYQELLQKFLRMTGRKKVYVLPSSIHEVLLLDDPTASVEDLKMMVTEINLTQVAPEERLSNNVYVLDENGLRVA